MISSVIEVQRLLQRIQFMLLKVKTNPAITDSNIMENKILT